MHTMRSAIVGRFVAAVLLAISMITSAASQEQPTEVRVVAGVVSPFVVKHDNQLTGFGIDLWNEISERLKVKTSYQVVTNLPDLFDALRSNRADVAVSSIFYTTERDRDFDFSLPILQAGLQVMVRTPDGSSSISPLWSVYDLLFSQSALIWLGVALLIVIVPAHVIWFLDRGKEDGASPSKSYFPGILDALVWTITALVSQVQLLPSNWFARVLGLLWMFAGVVFVALYTAELTATLTVEQIRGAINGPNDLPGKNVGTVTGSTAVSYLHEAGALVVEFSTPDEAYRALLDKRIDAIVGGSPALRYYAAHDDTGRTMVVGPEFMRQEIGFVFQLGSPLRRRVSSTLIAIQEDGTYQRIYDKWFGSD